MAFNPKQFNRREMQLSGSDPSKATCPPGVCTYWFAGRGCKTLPAWTEGPSACRLDHPDKYTKANECHKAARSECLDINCWRIHYDQDGEAWSGQQEYEEIEARKQKVQNWKDEKPWDQWGQQRDTAAAAASPAAPSPSDKPGTEGPVPPTPLPQAPSSWTEPPKMAEEKPLIDLDEPETMRWHSPSAKDIQNADNFRSQIVKYNQIHGVPGSVWDLLVARIDMPD